MTKAREEEYKALLTPWIDPSFWFQNALVHACWGNVQGTRQRPEPLSQIADWALANLR